MYLINAETYLFNDDCKGVNFEVSDEIARILVKLLLLFYADRFASYCKTWRLQINTDKTKIIIFGGNPRSNNTTFTIENENIEVVKEFKYL